MIDYDEDMTDYDDCEDEYEDAPEPITYCPRCSAPWYSLEGFCGGCEY